MTADTPLSSLPLPDRVIGVLSRHGVHTVGGVLRMTDTELRAVNGLGPTGVIYLRRALPDVGVASPRTPGGWT